MEGGVIDRRMMLEAKRKEIADRQAGRGRSGTVLYHVVGFWALCRATSFRASHRKVENAHPNPCGNVWITL